MPSQQKITGPPTFTPLQKPEPRFLTPNYPLSLEGRRYRSNGVDSSKLSQHIPSYILLCNLIEAVQHVGKTFCIHTVSPPPDPYVFVNQEYANEECVPERNSGTPHDLTIFLCQFFFLHSLTG